MLGLMQSDPINLISILVHAGKWHGEQEVVTNTVEGGIHRQTYADTLDRVTRLASSFSLYGIQQGDRVGTLGWNTHRHLEVWYAISGLGAICHTVNPRLFPGQIEFIVNHAEDRLLVVDLPFVDLVAELLPKLPSVERVIVMTDEEHMPDASTLPVAAISYEAFLSAGKHTFDWPVLDDNAASSLCYTSGTTGDPRGVLYSHRSSVLHAYAICGKDVFDLSCNDVILMLVPMFHANSWGLAYAAPMVGAKLILPGPHMDGASIQKIMDGEKVSKAAGVPTIWSNLLAHLNKSGQRIESLKEIVVGGAAVPRSMLEEFDKKYNVEAIHAWGMTEMSPVGVVNRRKPFMDDQNDAENLDVRCKQGRVPYGVDMKIVDADGEVLPHDGASFGKLMVRGPWTAASYFKSTNSILDDGWFDTGDIATIDQHGYMQITDRSRDIIKSGGEWISSVELENAAMCLPGIAIAACIGATHPKWGERPILLVKAADTEPPPEEEILKHLGQSFAKWQLPDAVIYVDDIPLTATGKIDKKPLRAAYGEYLIS